MDRSTIESLRAAIEAEERSSVSRCHLYAFEQEFQLLQDGISVIVPVHNGAAEMTGLLQSLVTQSLRSDHFEVIFALNACTDKSADMIRSMCTGSGLSYTILEREQPGISRARNEALGMTAFRYATFLDHDDFISRDYLQELLLLSSYRSIIVSNILRVENGSVGGDYAQRVIADAFAISNIYTADEIDLCYRPYTLNAIKVAPTYMLRAVRYDEALEHCEDIKYWRDVFHAFLPITVKSPGWRDIYYRSVRPLSASRGHRNLDDWARPRLSILRQIADEMMGHAPDSPQAKFDRRLTRLLLETLADRGVGVEELNLVRHSLDSAMADL